MAAYSTSNEYCDSRVPKTLHNNEQIQYIADNDQNALSERVSVLEFGMAAYSTSSEYCDLTLQETSQNYEEIQYMADNDQNVLSDRVSGLEFGMAAYSTSSDYCNLTLQETSQNYEQNQYLADNGQSVLSERVSGLEFGMAVYSTSSEYCELTLQETSQNYEQIQYLADNGQDVLSERVSERRCLTKRQRLTMLLVVTLILGVAFIVLIAVVVSSKHSDIGETGYDGTNCEKNVDECISNTCIHGVCQDGIGGYNCTCFKGYTGLKCEQNIHFCSPNPCMHGLCTDGVEAYQCECFAGFNGTNCDQESLASKDFWTGPVITDTKTMYVNYSLVYGQDTFSDLKACAEEFTDNQFLAVRVNEGTGTCEGLEWDWGSDPQYIGGYAYLHKTKTVDSYQPSITETFQWLLPGTFGLGGSVELYISIRRDMAWKEFEIMMLDVTDKSFGVYDSNPEVIMVYAQIQNQNGFASVHFKIWNGGWSNKLYMSKTSVADGNAHKFTFASQADVMQIFLDDTKVVEYTHPTDPATAKEIIISPYSIPTVDLHNITFIGI